MPFTVEKLPKEPIMLVTFGETFSIKTELPSFSDQIQTIMDMSAEPLYNITDASKLKVSFGDMISVLAAMTRGQMAILRHPNTRKLIGVVGSDLTRIGAKALKQAQYGGLEV